ncbi:MAG: glycoside hydrolase family 127 protein [Armatimonadota bacterium]
MDSAPLVDTSESPNARLQSLGIRNVEFRDEFWEPRRRSNRERTLFDQLRLCEETHRLRNFDRAAGKTDEPFAGFYYNDSDVYKWIEAASWSLAADPDHRLAEALEGVVARVAAAQRPDGYLNTYFSRERAEERWTNLRDKHEIYCAGHLIQAAIAHHRATNGRGLLDVAVRFAEHMAARFGDDASRVPGACGHPEAEMALVELYRTTGDAQFLSLARHMVSVRGRNPSLLGGSAYWQDHKPVVEQRSPDGHAVRQLYLAAGVADLCLEGEQGDLATANTELFENFTRYRMYVTGGAGSRWDGEAFGDDCELPSDRAYAETCAAIASVQWNHRLWLLNGDVRHADLMEWTLINAVLPGLSLDGDEYFYQNPLSDRGSHRRRPWFGCACCPPNIARTLAALPGMVAARDAGTVWVGQILASRIETADVRIDIEANLPWDPHVHVRAEGDVRGIRLRVPAWARGARRNGRPIAPGWCDLPLSGGRLDVHLEFPLAIRPLRGDPRITATRGQVAYHRGPVLYCAEACDHDGTDPHTMGVGSRPDWVSRPETIAGRSMRVLEGRGWVARREEASLWSEQRPGATEAIDVRLVPYHAWANRSSGPMSMWMLDGEGK